MNNIPDKSNECAANFPEFIWKRTKVDLSRSYVSSREHYRGDSVTGNPITIFVYVYEASFPTSIEVRIKINNRSFYHTKYWQASSMNHAISELRKDFQDEFNRYNLISKVIQSTFSGW